MQLTYPGQMNVDPLTGNLSYTVKDVSIPCRGGMQLEIIRYYNSISEHMSNGELAGWTFNYHERLLFEYTGDPARSKEVPNLGLEYVQTLLIPAPAGTPITLQAITVIRPDWQMRRFVRTDTGSFASVLPSLDVMAPVGDTFVLTFPGNGCHRFRSDGRLVSVEDVWGNRIQYVWTMRPDPIRLMAIVDPAGRTLRMGYAPGVMTCTDWAGRTWTYRLEDYRITSCTDCEGNVTGYHYYQEMRLDSGPGGTHEPVPPGVEIPGSPPLTSFTGMYKVVFPGGDFVVTYVRLSTPYRKKSPDILQAG